MNLDEKMKLKQEIKENKYSLISPFRISYFEFDLDYKSLNLYANMTNNTNCFSESEIFNLVSSARDSGQEQKKILEFTLIFKGGLEEIPDDIGDPTEFILNNLDKFIAIYTYQKSFEKHQYFVGFPREETTDIYDYIYLDMGLLFQKFKENNFEYKITTEYDNFLRPSQIDRECTKFIISYNPNKKENNEDVIVRSLKKEGK